MAPELSAWPGCKRQVNRPQDDTGSCRYQVPRGPNQATESAPRIRSDVETNQIRLPGPGSDTPFYETDRLGPQSAQDSRHGGRGVPGSSSKRSGGVPRQARPIHGAGHG